MQIRVKIWAIVAAFALNGFLFAGNAWADEEADWQAKIESGLELINEKNYETAVERFLEAGRLAPSAIESAVALYYEGYAHALDGYMENADQVLEQAHQIVLDENIVDKPFLVALYKLRSRVATELGDKIRADRYGVYAARNRTYDQNIWKTEDGSDLITHRQTGVKMPVTLGEFTREDVSAFLDDGRDVSVSYEQFIDGEEVRVTFYLTEVDVYHNEQGEPFTKAGFFTNAVSQIREISSNLDTIEEGTFAIPGRADLSPLTLILAGRYGGQAREVVSGLLVEEIPGLFIKVRYTYSASLGFEGRVALEKLLGDFDWPEQPAANDNLESASITYAPLDPEEFPSCGKKKPKKSGGSAIRDMMTSLTATMTYAAKAKDLVPEMPDSERACILETLIVNGNTATVYWIKKPQKDRFLNYRIELDHNGALSVLTLSSPEMLNSIIGKLMGSRRKRIYQFDYWTGEKVALLGLSSGRPGYKKVKRMIEQIMNGTASALASTSTTDEGGTLTINSDILDKSDD